MDQTIGNNVKRLREKRAWPQEHLAAAASISARTVQRIEQGGVASMESLTALAQALDVSVDDLRRSQEEETRQFERAISELKEIEERYVVVRLERIERASKLTSLASGSDALRFDHVDLTNDAEEDACAEVEGFLRDALDAWSDCGASTRRELERDLQSMIAALESLGFIVAAGHRATRVGLDGGTRAPITFNVLYVMVSRVAAPKLAVAVEKNAPIEFV